MSEKHKLDAILEKIRSMEDDVVSLMQEVETQAHKDGFEDGFQEGEEIGYQNGYAEGKRAFDKGFAEGYTQAVEDGKLREVSP